MTSNKNTVVRNSKIAWQKVDDKVVLVSPKRMKIHILSGCGESIWEHLKESKDVDEIAVLICKEYDTTEAQAKKDISEFVDKLTAEELVLVNN